MTFSARNLKINIATISWSIENVNGGKISCIFKPRAMIYGGEFFSLI